MKYLKTGFLLMMVCLFVVSCTPEKRLTKLLDKNPLLVETDTIITEKQIIETDTVYIDSVKVERTFELSLDTVYVVKKGKVTTQVVLTKDSINIQTVVEKDTIYYQDTTFVNDTTFHIKYVTDCESTKPFTWRWFWRYSKIIVITIILCLIVFTIFLKRIVG